MLPRFFKRTIFNTESESLVQDTYLADLESCSVLCRDFFLFFLKIPYISRVKNPPNCPQLRPIEKFWAILEEKVYKDKWEAVLLRCCSST